MSPDGWVVVPGPRLVRLEAGRAVQGGPVWTVDTEETRAEAEKEARDRNAAAG